jgi:hypothetical protein
LVGGERGAPPRSIDARLEGGGGGGEGATGYGVAGEGVDGETVFGVTLLLGFAGREAPASSICKAARRSIQLLAPGARNS